MRANPLVRAITIAAALTLAVTSVASAQTVDQEQTQFANEMGPTLESAVITSALDDADTNTLILRTARGYHTDPLGGKPTPPEKPKKNDKDKKEPPRGGFTTFEPFEDTASVTSAVRKLAGDAEPALLMVSGGDRKSNVDTARLNARTFIVDLNQPQPCLSESGQPDSESGQPDSEPGQPDLSGECVGASGAVPGNYGAVEFAVEEGAYLAGVVAARESRGLPLAIISGSAECLECDRYITGFTNGARSVDSAIEIELAYLANDEVSGFSDEAGAKTFTEAFLDIYQPGVLLPIGRAATMGMVEAACEADVKVIGAGIDISEQRPDLARECVMASITPEIARAVEESMFLFSTGENPPLITYDLARGGVTVTDEWRFASTKRVDTNDFYAEAETAILTGQVEPCPDGCGSFPRAAEPDVPVAD